MTGKRGGNKEGEAKEEGRGKRERGGVERKKKGSSCAPTKVLKSRHSACDG